MAVARKRSEELNGESQGAELCGRESGGESADESAPWAGSHAEPPVERDTRAAVARRAAPPAAAPAGEAVADDEDAADVEAGGATACSSSRKKRRKPGAKERAKARRLAQAADAADT